MTHTPERPFRDAVADWYRAHSDAESVEVEHYLHDVLWFVDVFVRRPDMNLYIECENDAPSIRGATGQILAYAGGDAYGVPMVVVPPGHTEELRVRWMQEGSRVLIREFDEQAGEWV